MLRRIKLSIADSSTFQLPRSPGIFIPTRSPRRSNVYTVSGCMSSISATSLTLKSFFMLAVKHPRVSIRARVTTRSSDCHGRCCSRSMNLATASGRTFQEPLSPGILEPTRSPLRRSSRTVSGCISSISAVSRTLRSFCIPQHTMRHPCFGLTAAPTLTGRQSSSPTVDMCSA